jgi:Family of unknown function (DUF6789)
MDMKGNVKRGVLGGFAATTVLLLLSLTKPWIPQLDLGAVLGWVASGVLSDLGLPGFPFAGVILHYAIGMFWWGAVFGIVEPIIPGGRLWVKGVYFGVVAGLLVMLMVLPLAGAGYLGMRVTVPAPLVTMVLHLVYGAVLGVTYGWLGERAGRPEPESGPP